MAEVIFTVGHSNHSIERFIELLSTHAITAIADVRSHPYSRFNPQFNRESLTQALRRADIEYVNLGKELGARSDDRSCYVGGKVEYSRLAETAAFQMGIERLQRGMGSHRIALMCAEKDPLTCHRSILICRHLAICGIESQHILEDNTIETHDEALGRLLAEEGFWENNLFQDRDELIVDAYDARGKQIAYVVPRAGEPSYPTVEV